MSEAVQRGAGPRAGQLEGGSVQRLLAWSQRNTVTARRVISAPQRPVDAHGHGGACRSPAGRMRVSERPSSRPDGQQPDGQPGS
eukprot:6132408-Heterocapsa_arctica.AAC.1